MRRRTAFALTRSSAFTLIELLIVVAIIAILAAIAVPNFLEAQTRSKVSRTKADMRSLGLAIEARAVDHNKYVDASAFMEFLPRLIPLTTPIAYITTLPEDVFVPNTPTFAGPFDYGLAYMVQGQYRRPYVFEYMLRVPEDADWSAFSSNSTALRWALKSAGPDQIPVWFGAPELTIYDPTYVQAVNMRSRAADRRLLLAFRPAALHIISSPNSIDST